MSDVPMPAADTLHAWAEIPRAELPKRSVAERVADFLEIYSTLDEQAARDEAMRCVQCPHPSCVEACPLGNCIPDWLALTAEGHFLEAAQLLKSSTCMGELFSRVCGDPCESQCVIDGPGAPVAINAVERFLQRYGDEHGLAEPTTPASTGKRVAVMDAGPCGLACAHDLARRGHAVTVFDEHVVPGGLLVQGTPAFKVERTIVQQRMQQLEKLGVQFRLGTQCGKDIDLSTLRRDFDAVFFGACAEEARPLTIPGAEFRGVYQGVAFLVQKHGRLDLDFSPIDVADRSVVVLGAGDTAMDCLRTAIRCGAREAIGIYRRDEDSVPASRTQLDAAREEGARVQFLAEPLEVLGNEAGQVSGVRCARTRLTAGSEGDRGPVERVAGEEWIVPADVILVAYGYEAAPFGGKGDLSEIAVDEEGRVRVDHQLMTSVSGVFAGGTLVRGRTRAVETVRDARRAAESIDRFLTATTRPLGAR